MLKHKFTHRTTRTACYIGYITQAIMINLMPLFYVTFQKEYSLSLTALSSLIAANFIAQLAADFVAARLGDRVPMRALLLFTQSTATVGLCLIGFLPEVLPSPFIGLLAAEIICGIAGGFTEVLISPLLEACPTEGKSAEMSFLHSFYCWGQAAVALFSTLYFTFVGIEHWKLLPILWALIPFSGILLFLVAPVYTLIDESERRPTVELFRQPRFWVFILMMLCAGGSEMIMSQWASSFCEAGLGVPKAVGDLAGPCMFAIMMGLSRIVYAKVSEKTSPTKIYAGACVLCIVSYLLAAFPLHPVLALLGCGLCGLSVGPFWPGTLSRASASLPTGGVAMFALLAVAGDIGCLVAPSAAGLISDLTGGNLSTSFVFALIFPVLLLAAVLLIGKAEKKKALQKD